ncbi:MAG TPA: DNA topoisomerase 3 [Vicinamibacteria bacterium]|jgi:DNA topoisomerase-3|nr:DNA topoisomerase 3 [Vicinamibacteria bacterium]
MKLVLAEKPSVAADIARVLGATEKKEAHYLGNGYTVTWARGHLLEIAAPEAMNPAWERWSTTTLPMIPSEWRYAPRKDSAGLLRAVSRMLREADQVIAATDAGREGEHIFRLIYEHSGSKAPIRRLWISSLTDDAIRAGFASLHEGARFDPLAAAARARACADWLVGLNATRAYTLLNHDKCTIGRVQTPTLAILVRRQEEIGAFKPTPYAEIHVTLEPGFRARLLLDGKPRILDLARAKAILEEISPLPSATVRTVETKEVRSSPPPLFNLLGLQKEANRRWGLTASRVLEIAQDLYERKHLTYPRTESRHLSTDMVKDLPGHVTALRADYPEAAAMAAEAFAKGPPGKAYVDDTKLTDHHAIISTTVIPGPNLPTELRNVWDLVARRFLAIFLPPSVTDETVALFDLGAPGQEAHTLRATGSVLKVPGWTILEAPSPHDQDKDDKEDKEEKEDAKDDQALPPLTVGQVVPKRDQRLLSKMTKPPRPYTDATILDAMKSAGRLVEDDELAAFMKEQGLGTPATRAAILERLVEVGYVERRKKALLPTPKGIAIIGQVHASLRDPLLTAQWEQRLKAIEDGEADASPFETEIVAYVRELVIEVLAGTPLAPTAIAHALGTCPACKVGTVRPTPKGWGCSRYKEGCGFTIWKQLAGKALNDKIVRELLNHGITGKTIAGFTSKAGKPFKAKLRLDEHHHVAFEFERAPRKEQHP